MKRPQGFDPDRATPGDRQPRARTPKPERAAPPPKRQRAEPSGRVGGPAAPRASAPAGASREPGPARRPARLPRPSRQPDPDAAARAELRRAARSRRKAERAEVRRFTRRSRTRRIALGTLAGLVVSIVLLVVTAVFSPILALREIRVAGTARVDPALIVDAVDGQLGTPLALLDYGGITAALGAFPLIRDYVTRVEPPGTLLIQITERQPVGQLAIPGGFRLVDPAGVGIQDSPDRTPALPVIDLGGAGPEAAGFDAAVAVLLALPAELLARVDSVTATTRDDVTLVLTGVGQAVRWGSAEQSEQKAALLASLIAMTDPAQPGTFDVTSPSNGIFQQG